MIDVRYERPGDAAPIRGVLEQAFGQGDEADIVDALRREDAIVLSMVATDSGVVVGHILFSTVTIQSETDSREVLGLGPMAVLPKYQNRGIGSQLIRAALKECRNLGHEIVVVLGHPEYYPRFGFSAASRHGIRWEIDVPDEAFMVLELQEGALSGIGGVVKYHPAFLGA